MLEPENSEQAKDKVRYCDKHDPFTFMKDNGKSRDKDKQSNQGKMKLGKYGCGSCLALCNAG